MQVGGTRCRDTSWQDFEPLVVSDVKKQKRSLLIERR